MQPLPPKRVISISPNLLPAFVPKSNSSPYQPSQPQPVSPTSAYPPSQHLTPAPPTTFSANEPPSKRFVLEFCLTCQQYRRRVSESPFSVDSPTTESVSCLLSTLINIKCI